MASKILVTLGILVYTVLIPCLEVNASHVFNDSWLPHAKFHEVWQLTTNISIGFIALWLTWFQKNTRLAAVLNIAVMGGVLTAHLLGGFYGGSIVSANIVSGGVAKTVLGLELAAFIAMLVVALSVWALIKGPKANG